MLHQWLGLGDDCAAFDVGLGCSGYPYGLYLAATMLRAGGHKRILMLHGVLHLMGYDHESDNGEMDRIEHKLRRRLGLE